jgi:hypothetical protein
MRATDIVRQVLDLLDQVEGQHDIKPGIIPDDETCGAEQGEPVASRFKQIFAMLDAPSKGPLGNSPNEVVADVDAVTTLAGGGVNGPKDPADIRVKDPGAYNGG